MIEKSGGGHIASILWVTSSFTSLVYCIFSNKSFSLLIWILFNISWHTYPAIYIFSKNNQCHQCAKMGHDRCSYGSYRLPSHCIRNLFRFYFLCAFIPGASSRSAGGICLSMGICIFYFIKASVYTITTLSCSRHAHTPISIFALSWIITHESSNFTINSFHGNVWCVR